MQCLCRRVSVRSCAGISAAAFTRVDAVQLDDVSFFLDDGALFCFVLNARLVLRALCFVAGQRACPVLRVLCLVDNPDQAAPCFAAKLLGTVQLLMAQPVIATGRACTQPPVKQVYGSPDRQVKFSNRVLSDTQ